MCSGPKVIFVNSFKGGAGKTTLSLAHCINNLFNDNAPHYTNTIYIDLDILGTGTCYLFREGLLQEEKSFERTRQAVEVELELDGRKDSMQVAYLSPSSKMRGLHGTEHFVNHQSIAEQFLKNDVFAYIRKQIQDVKSTLIVIDCAPGFSEVECGLMQQCYQLVREGKLEVEEDYITTLDTSHVQKCIQCLNDSVVRYQRAFGQRDIRIILNDVQDYYGYVKETTPDLLEQKRGEIVDKIQRSIGEEVRDKKISVIWWKYSREIAVENVYTQASVIENHPDWYVFTDENYKVMYDGKREER